MGGDIEVTAIENKPEIAKIYQDHFPDDKVIIGDAHEYLLKHFQEFDFIWSSPPCPSHSQVRKIATFSKDTGEIRQKPIYPDMTLYEEILFLQGYFKGKWVVENVIPWYKPLIEAQTIGSHLFWSNFLIIPLATQSRDHYGTIETLSERKGFDLSGYKCNKRLALRNCVEPEVGQRILECALNPIERQGTLL